jgi:hypothetical protein
MLQGLGIGEHRRVRVFPRLVHLTQGRVQQAAPQRIFLPAQAPPEREKGGLVSPAGLKGEAEEIFAFLVPGGERESPLEVFQIPDGGIEPPLGKILDGEVI